MSEPEPLRIKIAPGLFTEQTDRGAINRWKDGDKVRFHKGLQQKLGGWAEQDLDGGPLLGKARRLHEWKSLDRQGWIAVGTNSKLYLINQGAVYDITPLRRQITLTNPFDTLNGSSTVTVTDVGHDAIQGDYVTFSGATAVGGLTIDGEYKINTILGVDSYQIDAGSNASSTATGGGTVTAQYDINNGGEDTGLYHGWGVCGWGESTWGTPRGACSTMKRNLRIWSLDNWGEDLIASPSGGAVYRWDRTLGPNSRAQLIVEAPPTNQRVLVSAKDRQLICLGAYDDNAGSPDPLLIRVSDRGNFNNFGPATSQNRVYRKRIDRGSKIITGFLTRRNIIIFTDKSVHLMQPTENSLVFNVDNIAEGNTIIGPNAGISVDGKVYLMGMKDFFFYDGVYQKLPCDVWTKVFTTNNGAPGINLEQADKVYCFFNSVYGEVWWLYPSAASTECDRYVMSNVDEEHWSAGSLTRTAGNDRADPDDLPYMIDPNGGFFFHETGVDDDGNAMSSFLESYDMMIGEGKQSMHISRILPDASTATARLVGTLNVILITKKYPQTASYTTKGPYAITSATTFKGARARGRQMAIRYESNAVGADFRVGDFTYYAQEDHER